MSEKKSLISKYFIILLIILSISFVLVTLFLLQIISLYQATFGERDLLGLITISLSILAILLLTFTIVISVREYHHRIMRRTEYYDNNPNLTLKEIFEHEHRKKILKCVLNDPGIHHNELLRLCELQKGQLQWHLNVLLDNNIIRKEKFGQYSVYFPLFNEIEKIEEFINGLAKSDTTAKIYEIIKQDPGITSTEISNKIQIAKNSVKYHIDKLIKNNLIIAKKVGRKKKLYPSKIKKK
jgi:predicted transcriptional regulator